MKRKLYSELRTIYETTANDPHTFRITIKLRDRIDGDVLRHAVDRTMERYPYYRMRIYLDGDKVCFEDNVASVPVINTKQKIILGGEETSGHLIAFCYRDYRLYIDAYHGLMDGGGIAPLIKTLLYYYCSEYYGEKLSSDGIRLAGDPVADEEWDDPAAHILDSQHTGFVRKWNSPAFQIDRGGFTHITSETIAYNLRISEEHFMRFNISNDGSPATITALLLARAIDTLHPGTLLPPVIAMCVNQRKALNAPLAHQSLVGDVRLPYAGRIKDMTFSTQATCFRGMVAIQSDPDMVLDEIRDYQALISRLKALDSHKKRREYCVRRMEELSECITATVSYVGKADFGEAARYIQEYEALPSTALPSTHVPLTIEMSAVNGFFFINFIQYFKETDYYYAFLQQLRENEIDYDVLNMTEARYPDIELPF